MIQQSASKNCFVCGIDNPVSLHMEFFESDTDPIQVSAQYTVPEKYQSYPGIVHGGIVATMLDEVASRTIFRGDPLRIVVTARLSVKYRKPVPVETPLWLTGQIVEDKGKIVTVKGQISDKEGTVLAESEAVLVEVNPDFFGENLVSGEDWQVYPSGRQPVGDGEPIIKHPATDEVKNDH